MIISNSSKTTLLTHENSAGRQSMIAHDYPGPYTG